MRTVEGLRTVERLRTLGRAAAGRRRDWAVRIPRPWTAPVPAWIGPLLVTASVIVGWFAFAGATDDGGQSVALGLFVGAASITLMAWSFLLAVRARWLEPLFGGLDRMYQVHRWAGTLAIVAMFLHTSLEPEIDGGVLGASRSVASTAEDLAGVGEWALYILVAVSLIRWVPYRFWRLTHKLLGIPFVFACWHFVTAEKPYANGSPWGWYFGAIMIVGVVAYLYRVVVRDMIRRGRPYTIVGTELRGSTLEMELAPVGRPVAHRAGQFVVLKVADRDLAEPHVFTIASAPSSPHLRFFIRDLGDWTARLQRRDLVGTEVVVEGPYGAFEPFAPRGGPTLWIAGGVGITPFLAAIDSLDGTDVTATGRPTLIYCVRSRDDATALDRLEAAARRGDLDLHVVASAEGDRFSADYLATVLAGRTLDDAHVAVCGPAGLVGDASAAARRFGAGHVETEAFDFRSGIGPDLSRVVDEMMPSSRPAIEEPQPEPVP